MWHALWLFIRFSRPLALLGGMLTFALGTGIARYLGITLNWHLYFLGQLWTTSLQLFAHYFGEYFRPPAIPARNTPFLRQNSTQAGKKVPQREAALWGGLVMLTAAASLAVMLRAAGANSTALLVMFLIFAAGLVYTVPPMRLAETGYGELVLSVTVAGLIPALAFALQTGELHRLVVMSTFPLILLCIAMYIVFDLPAYANNLKHEQLTLLTRLGWQRAMTLHNLLILTAYILLAMAMRFGFPPSIGLPALLALPLGLLQIWYMTRIAAGAKPNWAILGWVAVAVCAATAYLLTFSFWTK
jgi:1,4-dihydroxy-2-naphthoate octaprenyltransferase